MQLNTPLELWMHPQLSQYSRRRKEVGLYSLSLRRCYRTHSPAALFEIATFPQKRFEFAQLLLPRLTRFPPAEE